MAFVSIRNKNQHISVTAAPLQLSRSDLAVQVEVKGRVNLDKLTAFLEELRVSKSRTVSLGTLMSARDASAADNTHLVEVRRWYITHRPRYTCVLPGLFECCYQVMKSIDVPAVLQHPWLHCIWFLLLSCVCAIDMHQRASCGATYTVVSSSEVWTEGCRFSQTKHRSLILFWGNLCCCMISAAVHSIVGVTGLHMLRVITCAVCKCTHGQTESHAGQACNLHMLCKRKSQRGKLV